MAVSENEFDTPELKVDHSCSKCVSPQPFLIKFQTYILLLQEEMESISWDFGGFASLECVLGLFVGFSLCLENEWTWSAEEVNVEKNFWFRFSTGQLAFCSVTWNIYSSSFWNKCININLNSIFSHLYAVEDAKKVSAEKNI